MQAKQVAERHCYSERPERVSTGLAADSRFDSAVDAAAEWSVKAQTQLQNKKLQRK